MGRENKKEAIANFHREQIMQAAESLFLEKGYSQTTIEDISKVSAYSRRTIYAYYESKDDILHHIMEKGLSELKTEIEKMIASDDSFITTYKHICMAMRHYQNTYCFSVSVVNQVNLSCYDIANSSDTVQHIVSLGTEINGLLAAFIEKGQELGMVRQEVVPMLSVYVLWSSLTSFLTLVQTKGDFICKQFSLSEKELLDYGFQQLAYSIVKTPI